MEKNMENEMDTSKREVASIRRTSSPARSRLPYPCRDIRGICLNSPNFISFGLDHPICV